MSALIADKEELVEEFEEISWHEGFLVSSIYPTAIIVSIYLLFVLKWGPAYMKNREPFKFKRVLIVYNFLIILHNCWIPYLAFKPEITPHLFKCACGSPTNQIVQNVYNQGIYVYYLSKLFELLDTVFFVLRKKDNQISFLHVYHHSLMAISSYIFMKHVQGSFGIFIGLLNSTVHIIMYTYYLIAALGPQYKKYLWWKKYITSIQLGQFVLMLISVLGIAAAGCEIPTPVILFLSGNIIIFLYLFSQFYNKNYQKKEELNINEDLSQKAKVH